MIDMFQGTGKPITSHGISQVAMLLGVADSLPSIWALLSVETSGFGFLPDRRPKILFERHIFHARTGGMFSATSPDLSNPRPGGYLGGASEYDRLKRAMALSRVSALESASWGVGQVMGFNASKIGFSSVDTMVDAFKQSEDGQLDGFAAFIHANGALAEAFRSKNWSQVAFFYNGANFATNAYDKKLAEAFQNYESALPNVDVRAAQARLTFLGFNTRGIDGIIGNATTDAMAAFARNKGLPAGNGHGLDQRTLEALEAAAGF